MKVEGMYSQINKPQTSQDVQEETPVEETVNTEEDNSSAIEEPSDPDIDNVTESDNTKIKLGDLTGKLDSHTRLMDVIKEIDEQYRTCASMSYKTIHEMDLDTEILNHILKYSSDDIHNLPEEELRSFLQAHNTRPNYTFSNTSKEEMVEMLLKVKTESNILYNMKHQQKKLKEEAAEILEEYVNRINSDKAIESRKERLNIIKNAYENETDSYKKKQYGKMAETLEKTFDYSFIFDRLESIGNKEVISIKDSFFDTAKGTYILERFRKNMNSLGYQQDLWHRFFNLEDIFLKEDDTYKPFNNLFLFGFMRFVAHCDMNAKEDRLFATTWCSLIVDLIYHKGDDNGIIDIIRRYDNYFLSYAEEFKEKNESYENHPIRIQKRMQHDLRRRSALLKQLEQLGKDKSTYNENMEIEELQAIYDDFVEELSARQAQDMLRHESPLPKESEESGPLSETEEALKEAIGVHTNPEPAPVQTEDEEESKESSEEN